MTTLSDSELARQAGVTVPVLMAIRAVESAARPNEIRFEPHVFLRDTSPTCRARASGSDPCTSAEIIANAIYSPSQIPYTPSGTRGAVSLVDAETNRAAFERAYALDPAAAVRATSWGTYQVLGGKLIALYGSAAAGVAAFWANPPDVSNRLIVKWMTDNPTAREAAARQDWFGFVCRYNGCGSRCTNREGCARYLSRFEAAYAAALGGGGSGMLLLLVAVGGTWWYLRRGPGKGQFKGLRGCPSCGGASHPASGSVLPSGKVVCGPCVRRSWDWLSKHGEKKYRVGPRGKGSRYVAFPTGVTKK